MTTIEISIILERLKRKNLLINTRHLTENDYSRKLAYPQIDTRKISELHKAKRVTDISENDSVISPADNNSAIIPFLCIRGSLYDGHDYIEQVIEKGIELLIVDEEWLENQSLKNVKQIVVTDTRKTLAVLASLFYDDPSGKLFLIGVTGTNGKTSIVKIIESVLLKQGVSAGSIGTLGYTMNGLHYETERTTPDITELHQILSEMITEGIRYVVMEVSSHALKLNRVYGIKFDIAVFTNLSREHLDFHTDMEDYYQSKKLLFSYLRENNGIAVINIDDDYGKNLYLDYTGEKYSVSAYSGDLVYTTKKRSFSETVFDIRSSNKLLSKITGQSLLSNFSIHTPLLGEHNAFNISVAYTAVMLTNECFAADSVIKSLPNMIRGRLERVESPAGCNCFIDYAHTPDAIENSCKTLRSIMYEQSDSLYSDIRNENLNGLSKALHRVGRLICVIGAGGDRDKGKRKEMTEAALKYSDLVIITSDNPRKESPESIIRDMVNGIDLYANYWIVVNREEAIETAILLADEEDVVLIAGKGHETYQVFANRTIVFNDYEVALKYLKASQTRAETLLQEERSDPVASEGITHSPATVELSIPIDPLQLALLLNESRCADDLSYDKSINENREMLRAVSTDSRTIKMNSLFVALKGEKFDGHNYVLEVLKEETNTAIVGDSYQLSDNQKQLQQRLIRVKDTQTAYSKIARKYRSLFQSTVIAITGSSGKTTTKEYCYNILSTSGWVLKNYANENNIIGVSKTLLRLTPEHDYAVIEIGSNRLGEIGVLADTCNPDIGIITNIGPSHLEFFGDLNGVFREKTALLNRDLKLAIVPLNSSYFDKLEGKFLRVGISEDKSKIQVSSVTEQPDSVLTKNISFPSGLREIIILDKDNSGSLFEINQERYRVPSGIVFNILNAAYAVTLAQAIGIDPESIRAGLKMPLVIEDRMQVFQSGKRTIISDCYNANPVSMKAAIDYWLAFKQESSHVAVLGDMLELGSKSVYYHSEIGRFLSEKSSELKQDTVILTVGNFAMHYCSAIESEESNNSMVKNKSLKREKLSGVRHYHFSNVEDLLRFDFDALIDKKAVILLKASHGIHLEKLKGRL